MQKNINAPRPLPAIAASLALLNLLLIVSLRGAWPGLGSFVGIPALAYVLLSITFIVAVLSVSLALAKPRKAIIIPLLTVSALFFCLYAAIVVMDIGDGVFLLREFLYGLLFLAGIALLVFFIFYYKDSRLSSNRAFKVGFLVVALVAIFAAVLDLRPNRFGVGPVVYAVGDDYQIVFTTTARSTAWVKVGDAKYYDTYAGYDVSETKVHKVSLPMAALDAAKSYTVYSKAMILRGPYGSLQGRTISAERRFRPVDPSDGIQCYSIADNHEFSGAAIKAGSYWGDKLDFLIIDGDTSSFLDRTGDLEFALKIASGITKGERPVVYARGNHETKGLLSTEFHRYVGADGEKFYYTFRLGPVWGVVLDLGEDHADNWYEFWGGAHFDEYRAEQSRFLDSLIATPSASYGAPGVRYRIGVSHVPVAFKENKDYIAQVRDLWTEKLDKMGLDFMIHGHFHELEYLSLDLPAGEPLRQKAAYTGTKDSSKVDGWRTASNFPAIIGSRRSDVQTTKVAENLFGQKLIGTAVDMEGDSVAVRFTNSKGAVVRTVGAWTGEDLGSCITFKTFAARQAGEAK
jgi:Ca2+/Na+ antiporter